MASHVLAVHPPMGEQEVLKSPVRVSFDNDLSNGSSHSSAYVKSPSTLARSLSGKSSKSLPGYQKRTTPASPTQQTNVHSTRLVSQGTAESTNGIAQYGGHEMRRESQTSFASSFSSDHSELGQSQTPTAASAARNIALGRSLYTMNGSEGNNMSTDQLFTIKPNNVPNSRIRQLRAARSQAVLDADASGLQAPAMVRIPTDKSVDRQMAALEVEPSLKDEVRQNGSGRVPSGGMTGLGIRGADLTPETVGAEAQHEWYSTDSTYGNGDLKRLDDISRRLNRSLPSLPLNRTQSNLTAVSAARGKKNKSKRPATEEEFSEHAVPTPMRLWEASQCHLLDEQGKKRRFGDFWDTYSTIGQPSNGSEATNGKHHKEGGKGGLKSIARSLAGHSHHSARHSISNGSWKIIKRYRATGRAAYHQHSAPRQVVTAIGVRQGKIAEEEMHEMKRLQQEEAEWREDRATELERIRQRKEARRGMAGGAVVPEQTGNEGLGLDTGIEDAEEEEEEEMDPEERRRQFDEYRQRTGLTVAEGEDFDGFVVRSLDMKGSFHKRLSTAMEQEEE
ncbi:hypothetical protein QFC22_002105 [Naganishia vaughanmartiniae]|uniref:Uncharacterized protein n=1 Tax=Naganishia vaughanmartiniae TaxID=1424756 RepID=A0ACC2XDH6_9TREE|nr:hypothetical protein QFC22_002105 [Naganishia vaughanmartiniae]